MDKENMMDIDMEETMIGKLTDMIEADPEKYSSMNKAQLLAAAEAEGIHITEEDCRQFLHVMTEDELGSVQGGIATPKSQSGKKRCPRCGSTNVKKSKAATVITSVLTAPLPFPIPSLDYVCKKCGTLFIQ